MNQPSFLKEAILRGYLEGQSRKKIKGPVLFLIGLLVLLPLGYGCFSGGDNGSSGVVPSPVARQYEISGIVSMPAAPLPASSVNRATGFNEGKHFISVVDKDNPSSEIGTASISGTAFNAVVPFTSLNRYAMLVVKDQSGRTLYKNLLGRLLKSADIPSTINIIRINGVRIDEISTARAAFGVDKGAPDVPIININSYEYSQPVIYRDNSSATSLDAALDTIAGGSNNINQAANAIITLAAVLNSTSLSEAVKNQISAPAATSKITDILISFVKALNDSSSRQMINNSGMATSVAIDGRTISQSVSESQVRDIINSVKPAESLTAPVISPNGLSGLISPVAVAITAASGTTIRYTTDGSVPSLVNGTVYSASFTISATTTVKAVAVKDGVLSSVSSALFSFYDKAVKPSMNPAGGTYSTPQQVVLTTATSGAMIKYTIDGTIPSETNGMTYTIPLTISASVTIKAVAIKSGMAASDMAGENYVIGSSEPVAAPVISPNGGAFNGAQTVSITTVTSGAVIKYTIDGTAPSASNGINYSGPFQAGSTLTVKAIAIKNGVLSAVSTQTYTISAAIAKPVIAPAGGNFLPPLEVTITCDTPGVTIFYTEDGAVPTISSAQYNPALKIVLNQSKTIKAIAAKASSTGSVTYSEVATAVFSAMQKAATPYFQPAAGAYNGAQSVTIATSTTGADIYYTADGSEPSAATAKYSGAIAVNSNMTIKAVAIKTGMAASDVASANYIINPAEVAEPEFDLATGTYSEPKYVALTCDTPGASIYYTTDGTEPSASSTLYNPANKIYLSSSEIVEIKAVAIKSGMQNSRIASRSYRIDQNAALFNIQYYSDPSLLNSLGDKPYLKAGTYYLKITSSKAIKEPPKLSISAEGSSNDTTDQPALHISGNEYKFTRTIYNDNAAIGAIQESIAISSIGANGVSSVNVRPLNESSKAAYTDTVAPVANIIYSPASTLKKNATLSIEANISEETVEQPALRLSMSGANILTAADMTKASTLKYTYTYQTQDGNGPVYLSLSGITDRAGNPIVQTPATGSSFTLDNSVPPLPGNIVISPVGGEIRVNTLNSTNTNLIITANIDSSKTSGGKAELYIGSLSSPVLIDSTIINGDTTVNFDLGTATNAALKALVPSGGEVKVRLYNGAGNYTDSVTNPTLTVDYTTPSAPVISNTFTATGGTVVSGKINSTNTNFTLSAAITANDAMGGKAQLYINNLLIKEYQPISSGQSSISFKALDNDSANLMQSAIPSPGGTIKVRLYDAAGNYSESSSNYSILANYSALTSPSGITLTPVGGTIVTNTLNSTNTNLTATATITAGQATGGRAELYVGTVKVAEDSSIGTADTSLAFNCGAAAEADLQSKISAGGQVSVKLYDAYGNTVVSTGGFTLTVKYDRPTVPSNITVTPVGGLVVADRLNATNTNLTAAATITAGSATGGKAELYVGGTKIAEDTSIGASDTTVSFDCGATSTATLQDKVKYSGTVQVKLYDSYGNYSSKAGNMLSVDYTSQPAPPQASKLFFNGAEKKVYFEADINGSPNDGGTDTTRKLTLYMRVTRGEQVAVYKYNSGFANNLAGSFAFSVGAGVDKFTRISGADIDSTFPAAADALEYAVADSYGNRSAYTADGTIPASPVVSAAGLENATGKINIGGTAITSLAVNTAIYVYYDNDGAGSSLTLHNYTVSNISHDGTNTSYNATEKAAWASIAAGKNLGYAIKDTTSGNVSKLTYDGTIPAAPDVTNIGYSRASQKSTVSAAGITANTSTSAILSMWQVDDANNATPAARGTKTGVNLSTLTSDLITAQTIANPKYIAYTITDENGNTSTFANDGQVPVAPVGANITWSDAVSKFKIRNGNVGSADTQLRIYRENIGLYTYLGRAVTLSNADLKGIYGVSEEFAARKTDNTAITVYNNDPVNDKVAYTLVNDNGNESAYDDGGLVPAKPDVTKLAYSKAAKKTIVSAGVVSVDADPGCILYCYQADDASGSGLISKGLKSGVDLTAHFGDLEANQDIAEDKFILYTFKNLAGNTSTYASDGKVPVAPTQAAVSASTFSNASGDVNIKATAFTALTNTKINVYEDNDGTYDAVNSLKKNWTALADNSGVNVIKSATAGGAWAAINAAEKPYVGYTIETAEGNESTVVFDTHTIPIAPVLPVAATLIAIGDGGTDAPAGYVNDAGKTSVTLSPGIALLTGEKLTLKVNKTNSATMTATATAGATPVFGGSTTNVTYAPAIPGSGNATTGKFDFTVGGGVSQVAEGTDVAITATKSSADGNESEWSAAVNITYDKTAPTLSFSQAAYVFANDAGVKIFILNASEDVRANSGLGYGTIDPAYGIKTFTVAGWAVPPTQFKFDNFLQGTAVTITSDNSANDTDAGGRIKPAVIQLGTAGIALFKDLAGNKMTNATVTVIFE